MNQTQAPSKELFGHPAGLFYLFFAELWGTIQFLWNESIVDSLHGQRNF